jgi:putative membrane protein
MDNLLVQGLVAATVYAVLGILIFVGALVAVDRMTPGTLWKEIIEEHNTALAVMMAGICIALSIVIAAAIL